MRIRLTKTGESDEFVHLHMAIGDQACGAIIVPRAEWEAFEERGTFMLEPGQSIEAELTAGAVSGEPDRGGSGRVARRDDG